MLLTLNVSLSIEAVAEALRIGVDTAKATWLERVQVLNMQRRPERGAPAYASAAVLDGEFTFYFDLRKPKIAGRGVEHGTRVEMTEKSLARAIKVIVLMYPDAFGRIAVSKPELQDCSVLLQLCLFGRIRF